MSDIIDDLLGSASSDSPTSIPDVGDLPNLSSSFSPSLSNLLPPATNMDDFDDLSDSAIDAVPTIPTLADSGLGSINTNGLLTFGENALSGLLGAFVVNPANAATAEGQAETTASLSQISTNQIFSWLFLGLIVFLIFGFLKGK